MLLTSLFAQARALCRALGKSGRGVGAARKGPGARRASFERLEMRELLSSVSPIPGVVVTSIGGATSDHANAGFLDSDGKIVVAGYTRAQDKYGIPRDNFAVLRYGPNGVLDPGFGTGGVVTTAIRFESSANAAAAYSGGRIVAAGSTGYYPATDFALARYNSNGSLDNTFNLQGTGKKATYGTVQTDLGGSDSIKGVVVQPDGKIVAAGQSNATGARRFTLARYTAGGRLDTTFNTTGVVTTSFGGTADNLNAVAIQQGKIVAAGSVYYSANGSEVFALARYNSDGRLDTTFGASDPNNPLAGTGKVITNQQYNGLIQAVAVYPSGSAYQDYIVVAGYTEMGGFAMELARYRPDGSLDTTFGSGGFVVTPDRTLARGVAIQPDGKIVAAGFADDLSNPNPLFLARYDTLGNLDTSFGSGGTLTTSIPNLGAEARSVLIQSNGKVVVSGFAYDFASPQRFFVALARYNPDGTFDGSFGASGAAGASAASPAALTDAALADAGRQQLALAALLQYEDQLQAKPAARSKGLEVPAVDLALAELGV